MKREESPDYSLLAHTYRPAAARYHTIIAVYALAAILVCMFVLMLWLPQLPWSIAPAAFKLYAITIACPIALWIAMLFIDRISVCLLISVLATWNIRLKTSRERAACYTFLWSCSRGDDRSGSHQQRIFGRDISCSQYSGNPK
jgi:hypothetical protein